MVRYSFAWPCILATLVLVFILFSKKLFWFIGLAIVLGVWRGSAYMKQVHQYTAMQGRVVVMSAWASEDGVYGKNSQLGFSATHVSIDGVPLKGKVQVSGFGLNSVYQGDELRVTGKLRPGFGSAQASVGFAKLVLVRHHNSLVSDLRRKFAAGMINALPEPLGSFAMGILIGQRATLPQNVKDDLRAVGLTHVIAVSGYNLTIMLRASQRIFAKHSKRMSLLLAFLLVGAFLLLAGSSASIVRAAIVSVLSLGAGYYGRSFKPVNLLLLAAAITVWWSPFYIWSDLGWYLSFLAFFGVMVLGPSVVHKISKGRELPTLVMVGVETLSAELMTIPLILHFFGQVSLAGLPANILVVSLVPLAMLLSLLSGVVGMCMSSLVGWISWPAIIVLNFMLDTAHVIAGIPRVFLQNLEFGIAQMIFMYVLIILVIILLTQKTKGQISVKITDKKLIL